MISKHQRTEYSPTIPFITKAININPEGKDVGPCHADHVLGIDNWVVSRQFLDLIVSFKSKGIEI